MNGQFRPQSKLSNPSGQGHLLLIILNLVLLAGVSVFIYLNSTSIDELKTKQDTSSGNINDLKKKYSDLNTKHLNLVEQDTYLQSVLQVFDRDLGVAKSDIRQLKTDQEINKGLINAINVNIEFIEKLRNDFTKSDGSVFDTTKFGDLMTNLKALSDELDIDKTAGTRHSLINYIKSAFTSPEFTKQVTSFDILSQVEKYERIKDTFIEQMDFVIIDGNLPTDELYSNIDISDTSDDMKGKIQSIYSNYMTMFIQVNIYKSIVENIIKEITKLETYIDSAKSGNTEANESYNNLQERLVGIKGNTNNSVTFMKVLDNSQAGTPIDIIDITSSDGLNTRMTELNITSIYECQMFLLHFRNKLNERISVLRPYI